MDETNAMAQHQQALLQRRRQQFLLQQCQQQQQQQQQQLLYHHQQQSQQYQNLQQQQANSPFPPNTNTAAYVRRAAFLRLLQQKQQRSPNPNPNPNPNPIPIPIPIPNPNLDQQEHLLHQHQRQLQHQLQQQQHQLHQQQHQLQQKQYQLIQHEMSFKDVGTVCHPDINQPFLNLEDACERLLPYHAVAEWEAEEDYGSLDPHTSRSRPRSEQSDNDFAAKSAGFTAAFEKQVASFNTLTRKRKAGELFRTEERLMIEQALLQDKRRALLEVQMGMESRKKAAEAMMRTTAMAQSQKAHAKSQSHAEMLARDPLWANLFVFQAGEGSGGHDMDGMKHGRGNEQRGDEVPSEDFLNDENDETGIQGK